jgi:hypothetical protein
VAKYSDIVACIFSASPRSSRTSCNYVISYPDDEKTYNSNVLPG